jgi:hypothetical protein
MLFKPMDCWAYRPMDPLSFRPMDCWVFRPMDRLGV